MYVMSQRTAIQKRQKFEPEETVILALETPF